MGTPPTVVVLLVRFTGSTVPASVVTDEPPSSASADSVPATVCASSTAFRVAASHVMVSTLAASKTASEGANSVNSPMPFSCA